MVQFSEVTSGTNMNLYSVFRQSADTIFICGGENDKGVFLASYNGGNTFNLIYDSFNLVIYDIYFISSSIGYACGGKADVYKTTNGGHSWEQVWVNVPAFPTEYRLPLRKIFSLSDSVFYFCGGGGFGKGSIVKGSNFGTQWTAQVFDVELRDIYFFNAQHGIACGYGIVLETTDSGNSWQVADSPDEFYTSIAISSSGKTLLSGYNGGVYCSDNDDFSLGELKPANEIFSTRDHINKLVTYQDKIFCCGTDGFFAVSTDNGNSWMKESTFNECTLKSMLLQSQSGGIVVGDDGKIFKFTF